MTLQNLFSESLKYLDLRVGIENLFLEVDNTLIHSRDTSGMRSNQSFMDSVIIRLPGFAHYYLCSQELYLKALSRLDRNPEQFFELGNSEEFVAARP